MIAASLLSRNGERPALKHRPLFITRYSSYSVDEPRWCFA